MNQVMSSPEKEEVVPAFSQRGVRGDLERI